MLHFTMATKRWEDSEEDGSDSKELHDELLCSTNHSSSSTSPNEWNTKCHKTKSRKKKSFPPLQASDWHEDDLEKIGIVYAPELVELSNIMKELNSLRPQATNLELPPLCKKLAEITLSVWKFSINSSSLAPGTPGISEEQERRKPHITETVSKRTSQLIDQQLEMVEEAKKSFTSMYEEVKNRVSEDVKRNPAADL